MCERVMATARDLESEIHKLQIVLSRSPCFQSTGENGKALLHSNRLSTTCRQSSFCSLQAQNVELVGWSPTSKDVCFESTSEIVLDIDSAESRRSCEYECENVALGCSSCCMQYMGLSTAASGETIRIGVAYRGSIF